MNILPPVKYSIVSLYYMTIYYFMRIHKIIIILWNKHLGRMWDIVLFFFAESKVELEKALNDIGKLLREEFCLKINTHT